MLARVEAAASPRPDDGGHASMSDAERRVASLAANGHTNRQIAEALYITVSTVEQHLTRVYRKLRVCGRTELPATCAARDADPGIPDGPTLRARSPRSL
jgi:DNA-binding CsgD family transcriptional regulator